MTFQVVMNNDASTGTEELQYVYMEETPVTEPAGPAREGMYYITSCVVQTSILRPITKLNFLLGLVGINTCSL